ncbi:MAG: hypothetical protein H0X37_07450 [Herpetosiphonaceae bacterium]|nr:hypothetical protein [Herpetosiphonaceae bacterium]
MLTSVEGVYHNGKIELTEQPTGLHGDVRVIVTFMPLNSVDLPARGIDVTAAAELRQRLTSFIDEWNSPEMDIYDSYPPATTKP